MLGHASAVLTLDTYADLFPDDLSWCRLRLTLPGRLLWDSLRTERNKGPNQDSRSGPLNCDNTSRGGGIRTHDLFVPNEARYQAAPHPA